MFSICKGGIYEEFVNSEKISLSEGERMGAVLLDREFNCHDQLSAQTAASGGLTASHLTVPHETALLGVTHSSRIRFSPAQILYNSREKVSKYKEIFDFYQVFRIIRGFFICCCCGLSHTSLKNFSTQHPASVNGRDERQAAMDRSGG